MKDVVEQMRQMIGEAGCLTAIMGFHGPLDRDIVEDPLGLPPSPVTRALAAYYRDARGIAGIPCHAYAMPLEGRWYVVLSTDERTLAVYRITNQGQLRRLRRWPAELNTEPTEPEENQ